MVAAADEGGRVMRPTQILVRGGDSEDVVLAAARAQARSVDVDVWLRMLLLVDPPTKIEDKEE
jgi:hypothetical protein